MVQAFLQTHFLKLLEREDYHTSLQVNKISRVNTGTSKLLQDCDKTIWLKVKFNLAIL